MLRSFSNGQVVTTQHFERQRTHFIFRMTARTERLETADTMLKELPSMADIASVAVFLASGMASKITGVTVDVTSGTTAALNYKIPPIAFLQR